MSRLSPIVALVVLVTVTPALVVAAPAEPSIFTLEYWSEAAGPKATSRSEVVRNLGLLAVGIIGLGFGVWRAITAFLQTRAATASAAAANAQAATAEQGLFTDRFSTAVEHLGSDQLTLRLGGIYALWRLIDESRTQDVASIIDILCAFVRAPPYAEEAEEPSAKGHKDPVPRPDVQAILTLIGGENAPYRGRLPDGYQINFSFADLTLADFSNANFSGGNLSSANLTKAFLLGVDLSDAELPGANLSNAQISEADLSGAHLLQVNVSEATLWDANLSNAYLFHANLSGADLSRANLSGAELHRANLSRARFFGAKILGADLSYARLSKAYLLNADLTGADLSNANLTEVDLAEANLKDTVLAHADLTGVKLASAKNLTQNQLAKVQFRVDHPPELPRGLVLPEAATAPEGPPAGRISKS